MEEHPNAEIVRRACKAFRNHDVPTLTEMIAEDAEFWVPGKNPTAGYYEGRDAILGYVAKTKELSGGTLRSYLHDVVANDKHSFAIEHFMAERGEHVLDARDVTLFHVIDGKIAHGTRFACNPYENDAFWSS